MQKLKLGKRKPRQDKRTLRLASYILALPAIPAATWGGHAVSIVAYDAEGLTAITWGQPQRLTWEFWDAYTDEAYAVLSHDWIEESGLNPDGFNFAQLTKDLSHVTQNS